MRVVFLGKPMSGKGTQADLLARRLRLAHVSTGDLLREEARKQSPLGKKAMSYMIRGALVPDALTFAVLRSRLPKKGFILDGFPRTVTQAKVLDKIARIDLVIDVHCTDATVIKRMLARRICADCGAIYGLDIRPKVQGICDRCGGALLQRADDTKNTIRQRLKVYTKETSPLAHYYTKNYFSVDGDAAIAQVQQKIMRKIETIK